MITIVPGVKPRATSKRWPQVLLALVVMAYSGALAVPVAWAVKIQVQAESGEPAPDAAVAVYLLRLSSGDDAGLRRVLAADRRDDLADQWRAYRAEMSRSGNPPSQLESGPHCGSVRFGTVSPWSPQRFMACRTVAAVGLGIRQRSVMQPSAVRGQPDRVMTFLAAVQAQEDAVSVVHRTRLHASHRGPGRWSGRRTAGGHVRKRPTPNTGWPRPYQRPGDATRPGDNTPRIIRTTGAESHTGPGDRGFPAGDDQR
ncbi:hypothetical protein GA0070216_114123 [Micromonospora matsumotoense]|uniref:Uncharacterized protein n=1 Tax=Micromonospora matsumotoense TaxID=121616 RepID=A0A1C5A880_9ACTN|nr:hypothetical protein GA0070216_114123 [Micromonospora matsumotoense]